MTDPSTPPDPVERPPVEVPSRRRRFARRGLWLLVGVGVIAFVVQGANRPADPHLEATPGADGGSERSPLPGFEEVAFRVTDRGGDASEWCALLADTVPLRAQGLMHQDDLRGYDAMVFRFEAPTTGEFYMRNTRIPLSIAFFDDDGRFVSSADMQPCPDDVADCPLHGADAPYLHAIEVAEGDLDDLGVGPGATLSFPGGGCGGG